MAETRQNEWYYQGIPVTTEQIPVWAVGFVYKISRLDKFGNKIRIYIGKKILSSSRRKRIGVREKAATKTRKTYKVEKKDSGWGSYWSSCKELQEDQKANPELFVREVLEWCFSKKNMTFIEMKYQFWYNVLQIDSYNSNIGGSIYRHDVDKKLYEDFLQRKRDAPRKPRVKKNVL